MKAKMLPIAMVIFLASLNGTAKPIEIAKCAPTEHETMMLKLLGNDLREKCQLRVSSYGESYPGHDLATTDSVEFIIQGRLIRRYGFTSNSGHGYRFKRSDVIKSLLTPHRSDLGSYEYAWILSFEKQLDHFKGEIKPLFDRYCK